MDSKPCLRCHKRLIPNNAGGVFGRQARLISDGHGPEGSAMTLDEAVRYALDHRAMPDA